jgi:hypothetical protein
MVLKTAAKIWDKYWWALLAAAAIVLYLYLRNQNLVGGPETQTAGGGGGGDTGPGSSGGGVGDGWADCAKFQAHLVAEQNPLLEVTAAKAYVMKEPGEPGTRVETLTAGDIAGIPTGGCKTVDGNLFVGLNTSGLSFQEELWISAKRVKVV